MIVPDYVQRAAQDYKAEYKSIYGVTPKIIWNGTWFRIAGQTQRVKLGRLKELTTQLRRRRESM